MKPPRNFTFAAFALPWNRGHSGDYNLDEVFAWVNPVVHSPKK